MSVSDAALAEVYRFLREIGRRNLPAAEEKQTPAPEDCQPTGNGRVGELPDGNTRRPHPAMLP